MNKDSIVQFVRFVSSLEPDEFMEIWRPFARLLCDDRESILLEEMVPAKTSSRLSYVSQHICSPEDFSFAFMKGKTTAHLPEHKASVKQLGGYLPIQIQSPRNNPKVNSRILSFVGHGEMELAFYQQQTFQYLNIYEAYFENCAYNYVLEYFVEPEKATDLLAELNNRTNVEAARFKVCRFSPTSKKISSPLL